jgi:cellulose synthase/poly-beta-1,6-N-acetylglucosamine synthase-like glycosyltransferase
MGGVDTRTASTTQHNGNGRVDATQHNGNGRVDATQHNGNGRVDVSVIIATYTAKRWDELDACLSAVSQQVVAPIEVIVVVDHNPGLFASASQAFRSAKVVENRRARGLAGARNAGIEAASGSIIAFVDDDARPEADWLERLYACFTDPTAVGAGGALIPRWSGGVARWLPTEFYWVFGCSYTGLPERLAPVRNPIGANMAVRRETLQEIGGFREDGPGEEAREIRSRGVVRARGNVPDDTDLAIRVKQRWPRSTWLYQPEAKVHHTVTRERASLSYFVRRSFEEGAGKAQLSAFVGAHDGLSSERRHLGVVLPHGVAKGIRQLLGGDLQGGLRAAVIVIGVISSAAGFLLARLGRAFEPDATNG